MVHPPYERLPALVRLLDDDEPGNVTQVLSAQGPGHVGTGDAQGRVAVVPERPGVGLSLDEDDEAGLPGFT